MVGYEKIYYGKVRASSDIEIAELQIHHFPKPEMAASSAARVLFHKLVVCVKHLHLSYPPLSQTRDFLGFHGH